MPRKITGKCFKCGGWGHKATDHQFTGQCFECGGWGHKAIDHHNNWIEQSEPIGESDDGQSAASERQGRLEIYSFPQDREHGPQEQVQPQEQAFRHGSGGIQEGSGGDAHVGVARNITEDTWPDLYEDFKKRTGIEDPCMLFMPSEDIREMENRLVHAPNASQAHEMIKNALRTMRQKGLLPSGLSGTSDGSLSVQSRGQAGYGTLPGARATAQSRGTGASLLGNNYRVQRPATGRGKGQQPHQMTMRDNRRVRAAVRKEEVDTREPLDDFGFIAFQGQENVGKQQRVQGGMTGQRSELDNPGTQASHPDAGDPNIGDGSSSGDRRERDPSIKWVGPNEVVGYNLSSDDVRALAHRFTRRYPQGASFSFEMIPNPAKDSSSPVIKGLDK